MTCRIRYIKKKEKENTIQYCLESTPEVRAGSQKNSQLIHLPEPNMNLRKGAKVWVEDKNLAWVAAEITNFKGKQVQVQTASGKTVLALPEKLFPRDADEEEEHGGVDDMTKLTYLNEPGVLYNLERRYALNDIYTYTGGILIAVNPFTKLPHLYNVHMMEQYKGAPFGELSPHVFAVADVSYRAMMNEGRSQSILVSGESGAGKTETTKLIMQYLTFVGGHAAGDDRSVEQQVLESNPLLEAFGNARTVRNDNSSRFGKFVEIQFDANGRISGAAIRTYLLERSRVVQITDPERNYHCFYQLCASGKDAEKYKLGHPSHCHYLNQSKTYELEGVSSAEEYMKTRRAMDIVGINHEDQEAIFRTLAAILHLGNIEFSPGREHDSSVIKDQKSTFHMQMAADLFRCDVDLLLATLSTRTIQTREGSIVKALDCNAAVASRDALAKTVYARLFDWYAYVNACLLVDKINMSVGQDLNSHIQIGVLDIYGFECFKHNSFEQFCINFANEKLQQHFNEHVFKMEQDEYRREEINWSYIEFIDNQDVLDLIEKKPIGIISLLDEACMFPKSTHETFATKLFQNFRGHPRLEKAKFSETDFTVSHYAGKVTYQTDSFLDKNRDYVVVEHCNLLASSKCPFVVGLFPSPPEESSRSSYKFSSVATRFKQQLQALMETLNATEPHYIRCVKPNLLNRPHKFENLSILHQLRCGGVLEAVRISLAGYPTRRTYSEFVDRFGLLAPEFVDTSYDEKQLTEEILRKLNLENFQLGKRKVFLRAGQIGVLDSRRAEVLDTAAKCVQRRFRTFIAHRNFISVRVAAIALQAYCRGCLSRKKFAARREAAAAVCLQKYVRRWQLRCAYLKLISAAVVIQSNIRGFSIRQKFLHGKKHRAATVIQARWRLCRFRSAFRHHKKSIIAIQCHWRQKLAKRELRRLKQEANEAGALRLAKNKLEKQLEDLTWRLHLERRMRVSTEDAKSVEISKLQKALESLNLELDASKLATISECNKNAVLQNQLELSIKEKSALEKEFTVMAEMRKENALLKVGNENVTLPYWLSNTSALLCLLQKNLRSNGFLSATTQRSGGNTGLPGRVAYGLKSPFKYLGFEDGMSHIDARYPAILFKQQLTACVEKIFGLIRDNIKKELSPLLGLCIQVPKNARVLAGKSRSPGGLPQQSPSSQWDSIIKFLDSLMNSLRENHVPSFFIRKLITQVFSFINMSLFNSLLLRRECCSFSNGEYVKSGLAELEKWIVNAKEEFAGTSWHELNYIRQAVGFLVIHQKRKKSLDEISHDLCPALTVRQIYRISTMYWDDKYGTQSVSNEVVAEMREMLNKDNQYLASNSFLLDDDLSIPFSTEDIDIAIPAVDPSDVQLPAFLSEYSCAQFLSQDQK
ncbi:myosin-15-like isoform X8 [Durio zibethinus]|uniref:Myosin-15-like isoform X8 n=1 Tax=Durio zibethinus TaxID=66656 RepID=A0A6P5XW45_DURZI|nr:myosin-15-like isoform X8 [Durio zibethinus]